MQDVPAWLSSIVWTDYRLAVLFTVILPLVLLIWAVVQRSEAIQKLMLIYWRVSSLLAITVYLLIGVLPIGFVSGWLARILIPLGLWYWVDLNEEIRDSPPSALKLSVVSWRWAVSLYCVLGAIGQIPVLRCATLASQQILNDGACRVWLDPPFLFREYFHGGVRPFVLGFFGILGLVIYVLYLGYFVFFRLGKRKRTAIEN
ncbi:DUF3177 family protein [Cyanobacteria bacterium FACHB-DQ100]|uniref:DUF3177 family protein n=1 Tax=unclassified Leptolyngbya TaxID=2650499 RepID=UPI0016804214|nr:DUF3177 family protein [Leptolyngbya sp. FACHB-17]MBD1824087.1 DUF3177 family protein [Cyanobacteria bacterium FACHB-DQ100]MBD2079162.1 DUF3177 family protein [Leptolyngbya sp. FACHB-17]